MADPARYDEMPGKNLFLVPGAGEVLPEDTAVFAARREAIDRELGKRVDDLLTVVSTALKGLNGVTVDLGAYYTRAEVDAKIADAGTFDSTAYYTRAETDARLAEAVTAVPAPDLSGYCTREEVTAMFADSAGIDPTNYYTRAEVDALLAPAPPGEGGPVDDAGMLAAYLAARG